MVVETPRQLFPNRDYKLITHVLGLELLANQGPSKHLTNWVDIGLLLHYYSHHRPHPRPRHRHRARPPSTDADTPPPHMAW